MQSFQFYEQEKEQKQANDSPRRRLSLQVSQLVIFYFKKMPMASYNDFSSKSSHVCCSGPEKRHLCFDYL